MIRRYKLLQDGDETHTEVQSKTKVRDILCKDSCEINSFFVNEIFLNLQLSQIIFVYIKLIKFLYKSKIANKRFLINLRERKNVV